MRPADAVMEKAQAEFAEYGNIGASIMELSHRGDVFMREYQRAENFLRQLLSVPVTMRFYFCKAAPPDSGGHTAEFD